MSVLLLIFGLMSQYKAVAAFSFVTSSYTKCSTFDRPQTALRDAAITDSPSTTTTTIDTDQDRNLTIAAAAPPFDGTPFELVAQLCANCLFQSEMRKDAVGKPGGTAASSATNWINDESSFVLQKALDRISLQLAEERTGLDRDEASTWIRWMRMTPTSLIVDLTEELGRAANETIQDEMLDMIDVSRDNFLQRLGCRLVLLPSGSPLKTPLVEPPASLIFGKLLYGGVSRYRLLESSNSNRPPRRAGERTDVKANLGDNVPVWVQYGGPNRMYEAVDMGPAAVLEVMLLPAGKQVPSITDVIGGDMAISRINWSPEKMFGLLQKDEKDRPDELDDVLSGSNIPMTLSGKERNEAFATDFQSSVGGLGPQIDSIVRRVLDGRVIRPADDDDDDVPQDETTAELSIAAMEAEELALLGLTPVKGLLLYGPPGCGKTALAREISRALRARAPKIVSAPELLDRWVGGSEKLVRALFADAEAELSACGGDARKSALHVIVIDEIDAVFRKRSTAEDSGEATRSSSVNQILAKLDGVNAIPNVLLIGMTNRRELLDEALLRPGRLEVQIEIPLPNREGRREILQIHFDALRKKGRLSKPLCYAIDGVVGYDNGQAEETLPDEKLNDDTLTNQDVPVTGRKRRAIKRAVSKIMDAIPVQNAYDLAADGVTGGFSGADIAGLVRCAGSLALSRARRDGGGIDGLLITLDDVKEALMEVKK